ncbi:DUF6461 domain-containing protein [Streptomyces sp. NK08204]|uniref:DUF6461 domain-containing protein n=1 Tax=Streptomyces sp. NK08204 TaxID=2873260 RepID=UPI001CED2A08|nr:DUF6461 domain-containing protein [Streptomyces sp. NK08204]
MSEITTAGDYRWLRERYADLMDAYCVTLVQGLTPEQLLKELGAGPDQRVTGVAGLSEPSYDAWDDYDGDETLVGVAALGDWTLMVEYNGFVGTLADVMLPVSRGRTVVSHFRNVNAVDHFYWFRDGAIRLHFEPLFAHDRDGDAPDCLLTEMRECGFDLSDADDRDTDLHTEAAFALAHRVTGVRLTPELFASLEFTCGLVARS